MSRGGKKGFGARCGNRRAIVPLREAEQKLILQIHDGLRSLVASGLLKGYPPAKRMGHLVKYLSEKKNYFHKMPKMLALFFAGLHIQQWDGELAKIAAVNARKCYVHYDKCKKTST